MKGIGGIEGRGTREEAGCFQKYKYSRKHNYSSRSQQHITCLSDILNLPVGQAHDQTDEKAILVSRLPLRDRMNRLRSLFFVCLEDVHICFQYAPPRMKIKGRGVDKFN